MTDSREMLETVSMEPAFNIDDLAAVVQALTDLDRDSTTCPPAMMALYTTDMLSATRAALDCPALPPMTPASSGPSCKPPPSPRTDAPPNAATTPLTTATAASIPRPPSALPSCAERN
jgi:hypothetical protein